MAASPARRAGLLSEKTVFLPVFQSRIVPGRILEENTEDPARRPREGPPTVTLRN
jgi:hypothetical protein